jgi:hypothetical protein
MLATQVFVDLVTLGFFIPWRLSGLLSGYPPTDTRPQARAKLGKAGNMSFESGVQGFFASRDNLSHQRDGNVAPGDRTRGKMNAR